MPDAREIECAVLGNDDPEASVARRDHARRASSTTTRPKYLDAGRKHRDPGRPATRRAAGRGAAAGDRGVSGDRRAGMSRVDFLLDGDDGRALPERDQHASRVSPPSACIRKLWEASGLPYPALVDRLIAWRSSATEKQRLDVGHAKAKAKAQAKARGRRDCRDRTRSRSVASSACSASASASLLPGCQAAQRGLTAAPTIGARLRRRSSTPTSMRAARSAVLDRACGPAPRGGLPGPRGARPVVARSSSTRTAARLDAAFLAQADAAIAEAERVDDARAPARRSLVLPRRRATARARSGACCASERLRPRATANGSRRLSSAPWRSIPAMHDAAFGIGLYRYYADVAPAACRFLRWLFLLPGGDRAGGLAQIERASQRRAAGARRGTVSDPLSISGTSTSRQEALALCADCRQRYPRNPLFRQIEAEILDVYSADHAAQPRGVRELLALPSTARSSRRARRGGGARSNIARAARSRSDSVIARADASSAARTDPHAPLERAWRARARCSARGRRGKHATELVHSRPTSVVMDGKIGIANARFLTTTNALCLTTDFSHP